MFYLDLDELEQLQNQVRFVSYNRWNLYSIYDKDHFTFLKNPQSIKQNLFQYLKSKEKKIPDKVYVLTNLRFLGYVFNPVSFYYCYLKDELIYIIAEVNNTFKEQKPILIDINNHTQKKNQFYYHINKKNFYVSPFVNYDTDLIFRFTKPEKKFLMQVDSAYIKENSVEYHVKASLVGKRKQLNLFHILLLTFMIPFVTLKVILAIHYHAFLLWLKKIPYYKKKEIDRVLIEKGVLYDN